MIKIDKIIPGGQALGTMEDGRKIFFWNALPGETVKEYQITKRKTNYFEAIATDIIKSSDFRVQPKDTHYLSTSPWQIMDHDYELKLKIDLIKEIFKEHKIIIEEPKINTDNKDYFYRNKMEYSLYWNKETSKIELAFHERGSHLKIPISNSSIEKPEILRQAQKIIEDLNKKGEPAYKYQSILLRANQAGVVSGGLFEKHHPHPVFKKLNDNILGQNYSYSPNGFFQINIPVYEMALKTIQSFIDTENVLDLYAGVGTIGLSVAHNHRLTLVEVDKSAYNELLKNCEQLSNNNNFQNNPTAILSKSEEVLNYIEPNQTVILDPPRAGCDNKLIEKLVEVRPKTIIYLSCNPATQARDIKLLLKKYHIKHVEIYNFFPHTPHIENLVVLC